LVLFNAIIQLNNPSVDVNKKEYKRVSEYSYASAGAIIRLLIVSIATPREKRFNIMTDIFMK